MLGAPAFWRQNLQLFWSLNFYIWYGAYRRTILYLCYKCRFLTHQEVPEAKVMWNVPCSIFTIQLIREVVETRLSWDRFCFSGIGQYAPITLGYLTWASKLATATGQVNFPVCQTAASLLFRRAAMPIYSWMHAACGNSMRSGSTNTSRRSNIGKAAYFFPVKTMLYKLLHVHSFNRHVYYIVTSEYSTKMSNAKIVLERQTIQWSFFELVLYSRRGKYLTIEHFSVKFGLHKHIFRWWRWAKSPIFLT